MKIKIIRKSRLNSLIEDITKRIDPTRGERLDAEFGKNTLAYHRIREDGTLIKTTEPLEECLMQNKIPGIDLGDWLRNPTSQGLPRKDTPDGDLHYWHPINNAIARFGADSGGAGLVCFLDPQYSSSALGVRAARLRKK